VILKIKQVNVSQLGKISTHQCKILKREEKISSEAEARNTLS
jgi:hypothetical protein